MKNLQEAIKNREPLKITVKDLDTMIYYYDKEKQRYQSEFGFITLETIAKTMLGKIDYIKIEGVENEQI